jgi:type IX secretion system PorP/SprF family membrane protein
MKTFNISLVIIFQILAFIAQGQDFHFAQSIQQTFLVNPASLGNQTEHKARISVLARTLWDNPGTQQSYVGAAVAFEWRHCISSTRNFFALGLNVQNDRGSLGGLSNTQVMPAFAYNQHLNNDWFLSFGGAIGMLNYGLRNQDLKFNAQYQNGYYNSDRDDRENLTGSGSTVLDMSAGVECYNNQMGMSFGFSWLHLNQPKYSFIDKKNNLGISFISHGTVSSIVDYGLLKGVSFKWLLRRQSLNGSNSNQWTLLTGGLNKWSFSKYNSLKMGAYIRWGGLPNQLLTSNAILPTAIFQTRDWSVNVSYDANISGLRTKFTGGMEVWLSYNFGNFDKCIHCSN